MSSRCALRRLRRLYCLAHAIDKCDDHDCKSSHEFKFFVSVSDKGFCNSIKNYNFSNDTVDLVHIQRWHAIRAAFTVYNVLDANSAATAYEAAYAAADTAAEAAKAFDSVRTYGVGCVAHEIAIDAVVEAIALAARYKAARDAHEAYYCPAARAARAADEAIACAVREAARVVSDTEEAANEAAAYAAFDALTKEVVVTSD